MIKELVEHIVRSLVEKPEAVSVEIVKRGDANVLEITVDTADRGKVIGREGQTIKTLRSLIGIIVPPGKKVAIDLVS